jgi:Uma2 family endonuclease
MSKVEEPQGQYYRIPKKVTLEAYLAMIADGTSRLEYHDGEVVNIKYATEEHGTIVVNLVGHLFNCVRGKDCKVYTQDREVWIAGCNKMYYPDLLMVCGEHSKKQMSTNVAATINPTVVIEVLSDSTERYDLKVKSKCYKKLSSLKQIIYVRQDEKDVVVLQKAENGKDWYHIEFSEDDEVVEIGDCKVTIQDIYEGIIFTNNPQHSSDSTL